MFIINGMFYLPFLVDFEFDLAGLDLIGPKSSTYSLFFIHAAKIRKILVTSKYSGRNLLLSCSFSSMIRVDAGKRLLKKQKSGYFHKGNNHLFLYYSCSYTLTSTSPFLFSRFHRYTSRCSSPWLEQSGTVHVTFTEVKEVLKSQITTSKHIL